MALFGSEKEPPASRLAGLSAPSQINMIGEGALFEGILRASSDLRVSGRIVGKLHVDGKVIITPEGTVEGEVVATSADIAGKVQGDVTVAERLVLKGQARIEGNVHAGRLVVEEGAAFNGKCAMGEATVPRPSRVEPSGTRARSDVATLS